MCKQQPSIVRCCCTYEGVTGKTRLPTSLTNTMIAKTWSHCSSCIGGNINGGITSQKNLGNSSKGERVLVCDL